MNREAFGEYNPVTCFAFFITAIVLGMFFLHPLFVICSFFCSSLYYFLINRKKALILTGSMMLLWIFVMLINPIFNTRGHHVLFSVFGRSYTIESMIYGFTLGGMLVTVLMWFACYNEVMTSDKFVWLFGRLLPSISLILSMILRLIPSFNKKADQINAARASIGMAGSSSAGKMDRARNGAVVAGALTNWALEGGIMTADSMRARGYGTAGRTCYQQYRFDRRNLFCILWILLFFSITVWSALHGGMKAEIVPDTRIAWFGNRYMAVGHMAYLLFMLVPSAINIREMIVWRVLRSKI